MAPQLWIDTDAATALASRLSTTATEADGLAGVIAGAARQAELPAPGVAVLGDLAEAQRAVSRVLHDRASLAAGFRLAPDALGHTEFALAVQDGESRLAALRADHDTDQAAGDAERLRVAVAAFDAPPTSGDRYAELVAADPTLAGVLDRVLAAGHDPAYRDALVLALGRPWRASLARLVGMHAVRTGQTGDTGPADPLADVGTVPVDLSFLPLFADGGPHPFDVAQGSLGDCGLLAALAAVAAGHPRWITELVHDRGDGTYDITIAGEVIIVDAQFPVGPDGTSRDDRGDVLWARLFEKAAAIYATEHGRRFLGVDLPDAVDPWSDGYASLSVALTTEWFDTIFGAHGRSDQLVVAVTPPGDVVAAMQAKLADGVPVTALTVTGMGFRQPHHLAVLQVPGDGTVTVLNPWGHLWGDDLTAVQHAVPSAVIDADHGIITLSLGDFLRAVALVEIGPGADADGDGLTEIVRQDRAVTVGPLVVAAAFQREAGTTGHLGLDGIDIGSGSRSTVTAHLGTGAADAGTGVSLLTGPQLIARPNVVITPERVHLGLDLGASGLFGVAVHADIDVQPVELVHDVVQAAGSVIHTAGNVLDRAGSVLDDLIPDLPGLPW